MCDGNHSSLVRVVRVFATIGLFVCWSRLVARSLDLHSDHDDMDAIPPLDNILLDVILPEKDKRKWNERQTSSPNNNNQQERLFLNFDEAAPRALLDISHALPNAVPFHRTIPREMAEHWDYHIAKRTNSTTSSLAKKTNLVFPWDKHKYETDYRALYLYNPSLVPLHHDNDPDQLSDEDLFKLTGGDSSVTYVAIFRANTGSKCFGPDRPMSMKTGEQVNYLAVTLLNANLQVVTDVLVDLNAGPFGGDYWRQKMEDCRLFLLRGAFYMTCNERMVRIHIQRRNTTNNNVEEKTFHTGPDTQLPYRYRNIYGDGLTVTVLAGVKKICGGKNFNIFRSRAHPSNPTTGPPFNYYIQTFPSPHKYRQLNIAHASASASSLFEPFPRGFSKEEMSQTPLPPPSFDGPDTFNTILACPDKSKNCSQPQEEPFFDDDKDRGTACCISLDLVLDDDNQHQEVMVGVSHTKLSWVRNAWWKRDIYGRYDHFGGARYLSRWVAYQTTPPFDIVKRSGWFCLGFGDKSEENTLAGCNQHDNQLDLFNTTFDCPKIHYISGISEYAGDSSKAIIAYGVSDCYPRMMVVEKAEIARLLVPG